jgi:acetyl esterase/lipase
MKILKNLFYLAFIGVLFFSCSNEDSELNSEPEIIEAYEALDVSYGSDSNQVFDIYLPEGRTENTNVLFLVHGGSWVGGDKEDMNGVRDYVLQNHPSLGIVNMNYTLAGANSPPIPMQTNDISAVVNYITSNKTSLIISDDIGFIGLSAGAHLSLLWSYANDTNNQVDMVCSIVGPANFTDPAYYNSANPVFQSMYILFGNPSIPFLESASPYHTATATSPPTLLFYGGQDPLVPNSQGIDLDSQLTNLGVPHEFTFYEEEGHGWYGQNLTDTFNKISNYINQYL